MNRTYHIARVTLPLHFRSEVMLANTIGIGAHLETRQVLNLSEHTFQTIV